jgi:hypothetical protein
MGLFFDEAERERPRRQRTAESNRITPRRPCPERPQLQADDTPADPYVVRLFKDLRKKPYCEQTTWDKLMRYLITLEPAG